MKLRKGKKYRKGLLLALSIAGFFCIWTGVVQAQNMGPAISIVPHTFDLSLEPGEEKRDRIKVYNKGEVAIPFALKIVEFGAKDVTGEMVMLEKQDQQTPNDWIKFEKKDFIVDPGQKEVINFSVHIPNNAEPQGYYAMALFEADISTLYFNENRVQVIPNMGVLFMLKVEGGLQTDEPLTILEYSVLDEHHLEGAEKVANFLAQPFISDDEQINVIKSEQPTFLVKIKNNDPYHKKLTGDIKLSGVGWRLENELEVQAVTILPGMTRKILVKGTTEENEQADDQARQEEQQDKRGSFGFMQANLKIEEEQGFSKQRQQLIIVFSWKMVALLLLPIILLIILVWMWRKKRTLLRQGYEGRGKKVYPVKSGKAGAKLFNGAKPKPKFKKHALGIVKKTEEKISDEIGSDEIEVKIAGSENVQSEKIKDFWKEFDDVPPSKPEKSPKGGSSSGRKKVYPVKSGKAGAKLLNRTKKKPTRKKVVPKKAKTTPYQSATGQARKKAVPRKQGRTTAVSKKTTQTKRRRKK